VTDSVQAEAQAAVVQSQTAERAGHGIAGAKPGDPRRNVTRRLAVAGVVDLDESASPWGNFNAGTGATRTT
jgi:hypothetical protein